MKRALAAVLLLALVNPSCSSLPDRTEEVKDWCMLNHSSVVEAGRDLGYAAKPESEPRLICVCGGSCGFSHDEAYAASCNTAYENREISQDEASE